MPSRKGLPVALGLVLALLLLEGAWQGWDVIQRYAHGHRAWLAFSVPMTMLVFASAWGLWRRRAWGWWLAAGLGATSLATYLLWVAMLVGTRVNLGAHGVPLSGWPFLQWRMLLAPGLTLATVILLFRKDVLAEIGGRVRTRIRRAAILAAVGILVPVLVNVVTTIGMALAFRTPNGRARINAFMGVTPPFSEFDHVSGTATLLQDGRILLAGWQSPRGGMTAEFYVPSGNTFTRAPDMPHARTFGPVAIRLKDGRVLVAGGMAPDEGTVDEIDLFDPKVNAWKTAGRTPKGTRLADAAPLPDGTVLLATEDGGTQGLLRFDPERGTLEAVGHPRMVVNGTPLATPLLDGQVLITHQDYGGADSKAPNAFLFDPASRTTKALPRMAQGRSQHQATLLADGRVLITGGALGAPSAELFDSRKGSFQPLEMLSPRSLHRAIALADGRVLIFGGVASSRMDLTPDIAPWTGKSAEEILKTVRAKAPAGPRELAAPCEIFDPRTCTFTKGPTPPFLALGGMGPRTGFQVVLPDGRLLVLGMAGPQAFDPASSSWSPIPGGGRQPHRP